MAAWIWILIAIAVVTVIVLAVWTAAKRRTTVLRGRFGPEYDRAVQAYDDRRTAEADLRAREKERARFEIRPLPENDRLRFADEWRQVQERFVDSPAQTVAAADSLVSEVMAAQGYPMRDFAAQADLVSVDHPGVTENYRSAHDIWQRSQSQQASTEDLRDALLRYRSLFDELLQPGGGSTAPAAGAAGSGETPAVVSGQSRAEAAGQAPAARGADPAASGADPAARGADPAAARGAAPLEGSATSAPAPGEPGTSDPAYSDEPLRGGGR